MIVNLIGLAGVQALIARLPVATTDEAMKELEIVGVDLLSKAANLAPKDLGDLRGSGFVETGWRGSLQNPVSEADKDTKSQRLNPEKPKSKELVIGFSEPYALKQHEMPIEHKDGERKYLQGPFEKNIDMYIKGIGEAIKKGVD